MLHLTCWNLQKPCCRETHDPSTSQQLLLSGPPVYHCVMLAYTKENISFSLPFRLRNNFYPPHTVIFQRPVLVWCHLLLHVLEQSYARSFSVFFAISLVTAGTCTLGSMWSDFFLLPKFPFFSYITCMNVVLFVLLCVLFECNFRVSIDAAVVAGPLTFFMYLNVSD